MKIEKDGAMKHGVHKLISQPYTTAKYAHGKGQTATSKAVSLIYIPDN